MIHNSNEVINGLIKMTKSHIDYANDLISISEEKLQYKQSKESWSVLECLEHINRYTSFYNEEISKKMKASSLTFTETFKSTYLGEKFSKNKELRKKNANRGSEHFIYMNRTFFGLYNLLNQNHLPFLIAVTSGLLKSCPYF